MTWHNVQVINGSVGSSSPYRPERLFGEICDPITYARASRDGVYGVLRLAVVGTYGI